MEDGGAAVKFRPVIDVRTLGPYAYGTESLVWWGMLGMIVVETAIFSILITSYFYLMSQSTVWPQGGFDPPKLLLPTVNTVVLVLSSVVMHWADKGIERDDQRRLSFGMIVAALLAVVFLVLKVVEYRDVPYRWDTSAYGSIVWTIIGFHSAHVVALLLKAVVVSVLAVRGYFDATRRIGVIINGMYWHFVVAIWIPLYVVLYWVPRMS